MSRAGAESRIESVSLPLDGRFYVKTGERELDSDLYELRLSPPSIVRLTQGSRIDVVTGCPNRVVVAASQAEVGFDSHLQELRDGRLESIPGLGRPPGYIPAMSPSCRLAYTWYADQRPDRQEVFLWDTGAAKPWVVAEGRASEIRVGNWGPSGELALVRGPYQGPETITVLGSDGSERAFDPGVRDIGGVHWSASETLAVNVLGSPAPATIPTSGLRPTAVLFLDLRTGHRSTLDGWWVLDRSPDGSELLVVDSASGRTLGVVGQGDQATVQEVARLGLPVWDAAWVPASLLDRESR